MPEILSRHGTTGTVTQVHRISRRCRPVRLLNTFCTPRMKIHQTEFGYGRNAEIKQLVFQNKVNFFFAFFFFTRTLCLVSDYQI
jgi:hypothetical protein